MTTYPANERRISEVERGLSCKAILPVPSDRALVVGDTLLFALAMTQAGQEPSYVKGGDSVMVFLTDVTDLEKTDPGTGQALFQLTWKPPGQSGSPEATRRAKTFKPRAVAAMAAPTPAARGAGESDAPTSGAW